MPISSKQCFVRFQEAKRTIPVDLAIFAQNNKSLHEFLTGLCPTALPPHATRHGLVVCHQGRIIRNDIKQGRVKVEENDTITVSLTRLKGGATFFNTADDDDHFVRVADENIDKNFPPLVSEARREGEDLVNGAIFLSETDKKSLL